MDYNAIDDAYHFLNCYDTIVIQHAFLSDRQTIMGRMIANIPAHLGYSRSYSDIHIYDNGKRKVIKFATVQDLNHLRGLIGEPFYISREKGYYDEDVLPDLGIEYVPWHTLSLAPFEDYIENGKYNGPLISQFYSIP